MLKVLVVFKDTKIDLPTSYHQGLGVTARRLAEALNTLYIKADAFPIKNGEYLWAKLNSDWQSYTHIVFMAPFVDAGFLERLFSNFHMQKFIIIYHSNLGFLSVDRFSVKSLELYLNLEKICPNFTASTNCLELSRSIELGSGRKFCYLPNLFPLPNKKPDRNFQIYPLNIGIFGAARVLKNWLTATVATMIIANKLKQKVNFHISTQRDEGAESTRENIKSLLALNTNINLIEVPWLDHDKFLDYLHDKMDLLLQPSFTETFNNVTAEGCISGVPSVVSDAIVWAPDSWKARSDSATSVAEVGMDLLNDPGAYKDGWKALTKYNKDASKIWLKWLGAKDESSIFQRISKLWSS
jgi:hypothetical protein